MARAKVAILTDPMPWGRDLLYEGARRIARSVRDIILPTRKYLNHHKYRGHFAVTRSLVEGLQNINASFNYNPRYPWQLADTVIVLSGVRTLRQAIRLKQHCKIKKLLAGPNIVVFSSDYDSLLAASEVDAVITPCEWVTDLYIEDNSTLKDRIFSWPAGVDTNYWQPDPVTKRDRILIFDKRNLEDDPDRVNPYVKYLLGQGWQVDVLVRCGEQGYTHEQYRYLLQRSSLMLGFTVGSESQGIAWVEAWSTDVPTLILKNISNSYQHRSFHCSTAPYLCPQNGLFFNDLEDFKIQFRYWESHREEFTPRAWTLKNMSDEVCADMLYQRLLTTEV